MPRNSAKRSHSGRAATAVWTALIVAAAVIASRWPSDLSPLVACLAATGACLLSVLAYVVFRTGRRTGTIATQLVALAAPLMFSAALFPGMSPAALTYLALLFGCTTVALLTAGGPASRPGLPSDQLLFSPPLQGGERISQRGKRRHRAGERSGGRFGVWRLVAAFLCCGVGRNSLTVDAADGLR